METHANMAASLRALLYLVLLGVAASELTKLKSNPNGNFAIGFQRGYINSGKYGVIVPKGDAVTMREVQIMGPVRDSVTMQFNTRTIVFSNWDGMFMLGTTVYTDKLGTLYFVRSDDKCVRKVYKKQMGEIQVIDKETLDKIYCEAVRAKVEKAVSQYINSPFKYLLPTASDTLKHTQGFPGGDFIQGLKHGEETCGQHTIEVPTGDERKLKTIKITAPGVSDEIIMVFSSDTKVFGSWDGLFYMGDKVFSVQPKTLVFKKSDGSCVKKYFVNKGPEIVIDRSVLLKQEDCFLIMSQAYGAMQKHRKPSVLSDNDGEKKKNKKKKVKHSSSSSDSNSSSGSSTSGSSSSSEDALKTKTKAVIVKKSSVSPKVQSPPPIHVTSTVVLPNKNQQGGQVVSPTVMVPLQDNPSQQNLLTLQGNQAKDFYVQGSNVQQPAMVLQPINVQDVYPSNLKNAPQDSFMLDGVGKIVNIQNNDIDLNTLGQPISLQGIDPNQQEVLPGGYIRIGRSVSQDSPQNVVNNQELNIDASAVETASRGTSDTKIIGVQKSNVISADSKNGSPDMETTQITTVTLPSSKDPNNIDGRQNGKQSPRDIYVDTNVIVDQDNQAKSNNEGMVLLPVKPVQKPVPLEGNKVVNIQRNQVTLGEDASAINIQRNTVTLNNPSMIGVIPVLDASSSPNMYVRVARHIKNSDSSNVVNIQKNDVDLIGSGDVKNIQNNNVEITEPKPTYMMSSKDGLFRFNIPKPSKVLNLQSNDVTGDGLTDVKNIQTNNVDLGSLDLPVVLPSHEPSVLVRIPRKVPDNVYVQQLTPNKVFNYQNNDVVLDDGGTVNNIQVNKVEVGNPSYRKIVKKRSPLIVGLAQPVPVTMVRNSMNDVVNIQKNDVDVTGTGDVTNIQKNIVDAERPDNILGLVARAQKNINFQNNDVSLHGVGDVKNIQINDVQINEPSAILVGKRKKRDISADVFNNQLVNIDGSSVNSGSPQGGKVLALQGNNFIAPIGPDGNPILPNMKSSQVTKLQLPPPPGASPSQAPQNMYIKTNVLFKNPQQPQTVPMYLQASNPNGPTILKLAPAPQPQILFSPQPQAPNAAMFFRNSQPSYLVPAASIQRQPNGASIQRQGPTYVLANRPTTLSSQGQPGAVVQAIRQPNGGVQTTVVNAPASAPSTGQGRIPVSLMNDLTMLKRIYNPSNMIVNIAQNTNFHKK